MDKPGDAIKLPNAPLAAGRFRSAGGRGPAEAGNLIEIWRTRQRRIQAKPIKDSVNRFMRRVVAPRRKKLMQLGRAWQELLPAELLDHSCLEGFRGGQLRVLVDSASHMSELDLLIREGMPDQLRQLCPSVPLSGIKLVYGNWYRTDEERNKIPVY